MKRKLRPGEQVFRNWFFRCWPRKRPAQSLNGLHVKSGSGRHLRVSPLELNNHEIITKPGRILMRRLTSSIVDSEWSFLILLALFLTGCHRPQSQQKMAPPAVTVAAVERRDVVEWEEFTGRTEAVQSVEVRPRVSGYRS